MDRLEKLAYAKCWNKQEDPSITCTGLKEQRNIIFFWSKPVDPVLPCHGSSELNASGIYDTIRRRPHDEMKSTLNSSEFMICVDYRVVSLK
jgi:hypothetical protein